MLAYLRDEKGHRYVVVYDKTEDDSEKLDLLTSRVIPNELHLEEHIIGQELSKDEINRINKYNDHVKVPWTLIWEK